MVVRIGSADRLMALVAGSLGTEQEQCTDVLTVVDRPKDEAKTA